jgi:hypothetical protein
MVLELRNPPYGTSVARRGIHVSVMKPAAAATPLSAIDTVIAASDAGLPLGSEVRAAGAPGAVRELALEPAPVLLELGPVVPDVVA